MWSGQTLAWHVPRETVAVGTVRTSAEPASAQPARGSGHKPEDIVLPITVLQEPPRAVDRAPAVQRQIIHPKGAVKACAMLNRTLTCKQH